MTESNASPTADATRRYRALLAVSESVIACREMRDLIRQLSERLQEIVPSDYVALVLHDPATDTMTRHVLHTTRPLHVEPAFPQPPEDSPSGWVLRNQRPLVIDDLAVETRWPKTIDAIRRFGVRATCIVPLTTAQRPLGTLGFGRMTPVAFTDADAAFVVEAARLVAVAVQNALNAQTADSLSRQLERERDRLRLLLDVNNAAVSNLELNAMFTAVSEPLRRTIPHEYTSLALRMPETGRILLQAIEVRGAPTILPAGSDLTRDDSPAGRAISTRSVLRLSRQDLDAWGSTATLRIAAAGVRSMCCVPLVARDRAVGSLNAASLQADAFDDDAVELLKQVAGQLAIAVDNALAFRQIAVLKDKLSQEKLYLEGEIRGRYNFEEIVGDSDALRAALRQAEIVAATDSTVLIRGETGTGKELIARVIHDLSRRRERTLVKINCAAIPTGLLESELFGHEKGAFTGAIAQKIGRFELADGGTLFLDEVGDIAPELQPKLLRVLQEREFERIGGTKTHKVDVRIVAATNRDLASMVEERAFRGDLYYRLNVFPIELPPLRERREDIAPLVRYFAQTAARRMNKRIETIPAETLDALRAYDWPGNVRELENLVERAVILSDDPVLHVPLGELRPPAARASSKDAATLSEVEREHILRAVRDADWVLGGPNGAAARLGMKRTTLQSRLVKMGIRKPM
jgi:formate hydrogenlyase transcriptional activator